MECKFCNHEMAVCKINHDFYQCEMCHTQIKIDVNSYAVDFYENKYLSDMEAEKRVMNLNKAHYERLYNTIQNNSNYIGVKNDIYNQKIDEVHCYGGGFPQIELSLGINNIFIYDFIAKQYEEKLYLLTDVYDISEKKLTFTNWNLEDGVVQSDKPVVLTFVHILEHVSIDTLDKTLNNIKENIATGSYVIIYQPNPNMAKTNRWCHYAEEHITLIPINTLTKHINSFGGFDVKVSVSFSDDLLIIFKKEN